MAHVTARVRPEEADLARRILPTTSWELFARMPVADRRHGLNVAHHLLAAGHDDRDLLAAALLHDAAKGRGMRLGHRVGGVLLEAFAPRLLARMARDDARSWRHGFWLYLHHGPMSADAALAAGCSPRVGALIRGDPSETDAPLADALRAADEAS